jgi:NAD(P)-dependent dehydrogenase (short-subunit alcohol dehydrogenase family)
MISKIQAIQSLVPGAEVSVAVHDDSVTWINYENPPVTDEQIAAEQQRLQMIHDWHEYRRNRAAEYPTIQEQLDALYHAGVFPPEMSARIRAVKEKYPAPTMTPEQLAALAIFLCGPDASEVRGVAWNMDGGWTAQ